MKIAKLLLRVILLLLIPCIFSVCSPEHEPNIYNPGQDNPNNADNPNNPDYPNNPNNPNGPNNPNSPDNPDNPNNPNDPNNNQDAPNVNDYYGNVVSYTQNNKTFKTILVEGSAYLPDFYIMQTELALNAPISINNSIEIPPIDRNSTGKITLSQFKEFLNNLREKTGIPFRLPTREEWEYAARGGKQSKGYLYSGSNSIDDVCWYKSNSYSRINDFAAKVPNELGIYDMSGNYSELTNDTDELYSITGFNCGGNWKSAADDCKPTSFANTTSPIDAQTIGIRLVYSRTNRPKGSPNLGDGKKSVVYMQDNKKYETVLVEGGASGLKDFYIMQTEIKFNTSICFNGGISVLGAITDKTADVMIKSNFRAFLNELREKTGIPFRLPTPEEWEWAAKGAVKSNGYTYSGSNNLDEVGWYASNSGRKLHEYAEKKPNELGIYDMSGNYEELTNETDDMYNVDGKTYGGSWKSPEAECAWYSFHAGLSSGNLGKYKEKNAFNSSYIGLRLVYTKQ